MIHTLVGPDNPPEERREMTNTETTQKPRAATASDVFAAIEALNERGHVARNKSILTEVANSRNCSIDPKTIQFHIKHLLRDGQISYYQPNCGRRRKQYHIEEGGAGPA
jgi:hypothetical protein